MNFKLHKHQDKVIDSTKRFILCLTGVQGGKTTVGAIWLLDKIYKAYKEGKRGDWLIGAPTEKILQQSTLVKFKDFIPSDWGVWREQKKCFELVWGDRIFVRSTENPEHLEGMTILGAWLDEAGQMKSQVWTYVQARVAINRGPVLMTTTPYALNWLYREVMKRGKQGDPDYDVITWSSVENPAFPEEDFERAKRTMPKAIFERRYLGLFTRLEGLVYPDFDMDTHVIEPFNIPDNWECFAGMDFGHTNPTAVLTLYHDKQNDMYYVADEFYEREASLRKISVICTKHPHKKIFADRQSAHLISELQHQYGVKSIAPCDNKIDVGVERIGMLLKAKKLKFFRGRCTNTIDEIEAYHYPPPSEDKEVKDKPVPIKNHAMDALRYAFSKPLPRDGSIGQRRQPQRRSRRFIISNPYTGY
jgi:PBSX family phage terminase large subunit